MRFGYIRGLAIAMLTLASCAFQAEAGVFRHAIPRETPAMNLNTGQPYYAPPIPYGHYVKDPIGCIHGAAGMAAGAVHGMVGKVCSLCKPCGRCGGPGCGSCGGLGLFKGHACGDCGADGCRSCGGGAGHGHGGGLFHHGGNDGVIMGDPQVVDTGFVSHGGKHNHAGLCGPGMPCASSQSVAVADPSSQSYIACGSCHGVGKGCGRCGGRGFFSKLKNCGLCGGHGRLGNGAACGGCAGLGHGCGDPGCSGRGHSLCNSCGGRGCNACNGCGLLHGLINKSHSILGKPRSIVSGLIHKHDVQYFVGPGGPVPITPGYVNYVNPVRSPRDFLAFPPFSDIMP
jgi:hypothetical protein